MKGDIINDKNNYDLYSFRKERPKKIMKWYADKKNLKILSCLPVQNDDKGFEILFSYSENNE